MPRPLIQFSLADMLAGVLMFGLSVALIRHLEPEPWLLWTLAALAAFCELLGIVWVHHVLCDAREKGGAVVAGTTTVLGAAIGFIASPVIVVTIPGFIVLALLIGGLVGAMSLVERLVSFTPPPPSSPAGSDENDAP